MISRFYMAISLVPHGDMQQGDVASPEPAASKAFKVQGSGFRVQGLGLRAQVFN